MDGIFLYSAVFLYGLLIGSFLNVCIYRIPLGQSIVFARSHCIACKKPILKRDLIPVISYLLLGGRCRSCNTVISIRYMLTELANAVLYIILFFTFGFSVEFVLYAILTSVLLVITLIDIEHTIIPDGLLITVLATGLMYHTLNLFWFAKQGYMGNIINAAIGFFAASLILYLAMVISKGGMGGGDIKMMAVFGLCIGWQKILLALILAAGIGSLVGIYLMIAKKADKKTAIPFGPYLAAGILTAILYGDKLIKWYLGLCNL